MSKDTYTDISNAPIAPGDILKIFNEASEVKRTFLVNNIEDNEDSTIRTISARVVDTSDPNERIGVEVDFNLPRAQPILGVLIKADETFSRLSTVETNDLTSLELYKWLMSRTADNYGAPFKKCVEFLIEAGYIPRGGTYDVARTYVRALMRQRGELFRSSGGMIFGTGIEAEHKIKAGKDIGGGVVVVRRIKLSKLHAGIRLIVESGLFGDFIIDAE